MARRQKGPTPEEMIEKLEESFNAFKEDYTKQLEEVKNDNSIAIAELKDEHDIVKESNQEQGASLKLVILEFLKLILKENSI